MKRITIWVLVNVDGGLYREAPVLKPGGIKAFVTEAQARAFADHLNETPERPPVSVDTLTGSVILLASFGFDRLWLVTCPEAQG